MRKESAVAIAIFVIAASHAGAAIRVTRDGESVHDAELCYYAAAGTENPFAQQFFQKRHLIGRGAHGKKLGRQGPICKLKNQHILIRRYVLGSLINRQPNCSCESASPALLFNRMIRA